MKFLIFILSFLVLSGCSGNSALIKSTTEFYTGSAYQHPGYTQHATPSHIYVLGDTAYIGGDVEPREKLRKVATLDTIDFFMGASRDGVGVNRLENYAKDLALTEGTLAPFIVQPQIFLAGAEWDSGIGWAVRDSVLTVNDALPPEFQIQISFDSYPETLDKGDIVVVIESPEEVRTNCGVTAVACAGSEIIDGFTQYAAILIPDDLHTRDCVEGVCYHSPRTTITHELLHALGVQGHVDSIEFPDSLMGTSGDFFPNPGFTIHRIDREALQIMYMSQRTDIYNDWGEWTDTSLHLVGRDQDDQIHFGVALFNGLPQPWVRGIEPITALHNNRLLYGLVTWEGALLGFSGPSAVSGYASLEVNLATVLNLGARHDLRFTDLEFINKFESIDPWFPERNLKYEVFLDAENNTFGYFPETILDTEGLIQGVRRHSYLDSCPPD